MSHLAQSVALNASLYMESQLYKVKITRLIPELRLFPVCCLTRWGAGPLQTPKLMIIYRRLFHKKVISNDSLQLTYITNIFTVLIRMGGNAIVKALPAGSCFPRYFTCIESLNKKINAFRCHHTYEDMYKH